VDGQHLLDDKTGTKAQSRQTLFSPIWSLFIKAYWHLVCRFITPHFCSFLQSPEMCIYFQLLESVNLLSTYLHRHAILVKGLLVLR